MTAINSGISVIVCCYNSASRLSETIKHLALQVVPKEVSWEVVLVDNASTDNTVEFALLESNKYSQLQGKCQVVYEKKPGLSYARQQGAKYAKYNYLIFCDDDNWLDQNYLYNAFQIMEGNSKIGALGGISSAVTNNSEFPVWFEDVKNGYAVGAQSPIQGNVSKICTLWGAGLVTRTGLFLNCFDAKYPSLMTDRVGNTLSAGGDDEICFRILLKGYELYYDQSLKFIHFIPSERCSQEYFDKLFNEKDTRKSIVNELNKYSLLYRLISSNDIIKPLIVLKTLLGYLSSILFLRNSWSLSDAKSIIYFYSRIDLGVSTSTKMIYQFYKSEELD